MIMNILSITTTPSHICVPDTTRRDKWLRQDFPNPQTDIGRCGRNCKRSFVCDPGHIISRSQADRLDSLIGTVATSGKCDCTQCSYPDGYNISVALVPAMEIPSWSDKQSEAREFTHYLRQTWNFQKCGNNIVIFVSRDDRKIYTDAGPNAFRVLTLDCIEDVYNDVKQTFTNGEYYKGLKDMIDHYKLILENGNCDHVKTHKSSTIEFVKGFFICLFLILLVIVFVYQWKRKSTGRHSFWGGGGGRGSGGGGGGGGGGGFSGGGSGDGGGGGGGSF